MRGIPEPLRRAEEERGFIDRLGRDQLRLCFAVARLPEPLLGPLGIALEEIGIMYPFAGLELGPCKAQVLDRRLIVREEAIEGAGPDDLVDARFNPVQKNPRRSHAGR